VNGPADPALRLPNIVNVTVAGTDQEGLLIGLDMDGVAASGASACQSGSASSSHVLAAMGARADGASIRLSLGWTTSEAEVDFAAAAFGHVVAQLRAEEAPAAF
jgi:cysteine desulfurase